MTIASRAKRNLFEVISEGADAAAEGRAYSAASRMAL
jgi:hypothetical protein